MKSLLLTLVLSITGLSTGAFALIHALDNAVASSSIAQAPGHKLDPQVSKLLAMM